MSLLSMFRPSKVSSPETQEQAAIADYIISWMNYHSPFLVVDRLSEVSVARFISPAVVIGLLPHRDVIQISNLSTKQDLILEDVPKELINKMQVTIAAIRANNVKAISLQDVKDILG